VDVATLRDLFRGLQVFQSYREAHNITEVKGPDGSVHSIYDIEYLYECRTTLSPRQRQAIELFLYRNIREKDVAKIMQGSETNPIAIYATQGLVKICEMIDSGQLPKYRSETARS
jgi:DNA-directed RNA polymerase specialized sigma subunit